MKKKSENPMTFFLAWELTLKSPITNAADDNLKIFFYNFLEKIRFDILCKSPDDLYEMSSLIFSAKL